MVDVSEDTFRREHLIRFENSARTFTGEDGVRYRWKEKWAKLLVRRRERVILIVDLDSNPAAVLS